MNDLSVKTKANAATLALGALFVLVLVAVSMRESLTALVSPAAHYRLRHDVASLSQVLQHSVREGDPLTKIEFLLGPGKPDDSGRIRTATASIFSRKPGLLPDGLEDRDEFIGYKAGTSMFFLQIRDGSLINFNPADYNVSGMTFTPLGSK